MDRVPRSVGMIRDVVARQISRDLEQQQLRALYGASSVTTSTAATSARPLSWDDVVAAAHDVAPPPDIFNRATRLQLSPRVFDVVAAHRHLLSGALVIERDKRLADGIGLGWRRQRPEEARASELLEAGGEVCVWMCVPGNPTPEDEHAASLRAAGESYRRTDEAVAATLRSVGLGPGFKGSD